MSQRNPRAMGAFGANVSRRYPASAATLFRAWTEAGSARSWLASGGEVTMNPVVGGLYYIGMIYQGDLYPHYGRYLQVEPARKLEFTWVSEGTRGKESVVTVSFTPSGKETELSIVHEGLPDEATAADHEGGWKEILEVLATSTPG